MAPTETPLTAHDDRAEKRRLEVMQDVAVRLARLAESKRSDLAVRALEALRQKLRLLKMQALAAIMRGDRSVALTLADEVAELARAIVASEREAQAAGQQTFGADDTLVPILGPQTKSADSTPPIAGETVAEMTARRRPDGASGDDDGNAADLVRAALGLRDAPAISDTHDLVASLTKRSSPLLPLFDTSDGPDAVASEAASLIRSLRRAANRPARPHGTIDPAARADASVIAASLGNVGVAAMAMVSVA
ncbi:hypothetical protein ACMGDM_10480 [Sphingomonas sp. DT-51]|uniref:hypothetical protein n=1 Tax=Sphingomonas sp. DT-51 TaxID=3396165 RepID=UPI003F1C1883